MTTRMATGLICLFSVLSGVVSFTAPPVPRSFHSKVVGSATTALSVKFGVEEYYNDEREKKVSTDLSPMQALSKSMAIGMIAFTTLLGPLNVPGNIGVPPSTPVASAQESRIIGELKGSGLFFKDNLEIESFEDPKVKGVTLYVSNFQRPLTERLQKDFFSDPSSAAVGCAKTGPVQIASNIVIGKEGEEVFKESKSLLFKSLRVQRIYDKEKNTMVYVSFNTRIDKNDDSNKSRFKSSLCAVNLDEPGAPAAASAQAAAVPVTAAP